MDVVLVGFIAAFIFGGWRTGFLRRLLGIVFLVAALVLGAYFRYPVGAIASQLFKDIPSDYANLVGYAIAFPVILAALHITAHVVIGKVAVSGMTKEVDAALGAVLGAVEAILILSAVIVIVDAYFGTSSVIADAVAPGMLKDFTKALNGAETVKLLRGTTVPVVLAILGPLLPKDLGSLRPTGLPNKLPFPIPKK
jgi:uncharacterized membrane protein required for colicin V production